VEGETSLILITHDLGVVADMCQRVNVMYAGTVVEAGSTRALFSTPRHPYTFGLLKSIPRLDAARKRSLQPIRGAPRNMLSPPDWCPFAPRCDNAIGVCVEHLPPLEPIGDAQEAACFNPVAEDAWARTKLEGVA
jgi:oligopeptide transport system ATP-binding protein